MFWLSIHTCPYSEILSDQTSALIVCYTSVHVFQGSDLPSRELLYLDLLHAMWTHAQRPRGQKAIIPRPWGLTLASRGFIAGPTVNNIETFSTRRLSRMVMWSPDQCWTTVSLKTNDKYNVTTMAETFSSALSHDRRHMLGLLCIRFFIQARAEIRTNAGIKPTTLHWANHHPLHRRCLRFLNNRKQNAYTPPRFSSL